MRKEVTLREEVTVDAFSTNSPHGISIYNDVPPPRPQLLGGGWTKILVKCPANPEPHVTPQPETLLPLRQPVVQSYRVSVSFTGRFVPPLEAGATLIHPLKITSSEPLKVPPVLKILTH